MKKILFALLLSSITFTSFGQQIWPKTTPLFAQSGNSSTWTQNNGIFYPVVGLVLPTYLDTAAANTALYPDVTPFLMMATADGRFWVRSYTANKWNEFLTSGSSGVGTVTSVGLSMPSAFSVANSPVTGAGTLAVTGAGTTAQYIRGDGSLATLPTTGQRFGVSGEDVRATAARYFSGGSQTFTLDSLAATDINTRTTSPITLRATNGTDTSMLTVVKGSLPSQKKFETFVTLTASSAYSKITQQGGSIQQNVFVNGNQTGSSHVGNGFVSLEAAESGGRNGYIYNWVDSIVLQPGLGNLIIDSLNNETSTNTLMGWTSTAGGNRGKVGNVPLGTGLQFSPAGTLSVTSAISGINVIDSLNFIDVNRDYAAYPDDGIDDTPAIQLALNAAAAATASRVTLYFSRPGVYNIDGALVTSLNSVNPNCQLYIPLSTDTVTNLKRIRLLGSSPPHFLTSGVGGSNQNNYGIVFKSGIIGTGVTPSVIGSPWFTDAFGNFNYTGVDVDNITFVTRTKTAGVDIAPTMTALNLSAPFQVTVGMTGAVKIITESSAGTSPLGTGTTGLLMPGLNNRALVEIGDLNVNGYENGIIVSEHLYAKNIFFGHCVNGVVVNAGFHGNYIASLSAEGCVNSITINSTQDITVGNYKTEHVTDALWYDFVYDVNFAASTGNVTILHAQPVLEGVGNISVLTSNNLNRIRLFSMWNSEDQTITGNLGVGVQSPGYKVDVDGVINAQFTTAGRTAHANYKATSPLNNFPQSQIEIGQSASDNNIQFYVAPLYSSAGVGIPAYMGVSTNGNGTDVNSYQMTIGATSSLATLASSRAQGGGTGTSIAISPNNVEAMRLTAAGAIRFNAYTAGAIISDGIGNLTSVAPSTSGNVLTSNGTTWVSSAAAGGASTWNAITNPTADQALTFDAGESSTWTNSNTTEDLFTVNSSTLTTSSFFSLNSTSTALASGNNLMELVMSGANGTAAITATGLRISVTNTNETSGTNTGINVTASGATTDNLAISALGRVIINNNGSSLGGLDVLNTLDNASVQMAIYEGDRATPADGDESYISYRLSDIAGAQQEFARMSIVGVDASAGTIDSRIDFSVATANTLATEWSMDGVGFFPSANDGAALGRATTNMVSDIFLASGSVVNFNAGDVTITHSADLLTFSGASNGFVFAASIVPSGAQFLGNPADGWNTVNVGNADGGGANGVIAFNNNDITLTRASNQLTLAGGVWIANTSSFFGGTTSPTAYGHFAASTTAASTGSIKIVEGSRQTAAEDGTLNYVSNNLEFAEGAGPTVYILAKTLTATATLDFGSTVAGTSTDLTVTLTGAADGDAVSIAVPNGSTLSNGVFTAWISSANTATIRFSNNSLAATLDPASGTFRVSVIKY